jgi:hypothetical protein
MPSYTGNAPVFRLHPLPIDPKNVCRYDSLDAIGREWEKCVHAIEDRGDGESAQKMREVWDAFEREASVVPPPRGTHEFR